MARVLTFREHSVQTAHRPAYLADAAHRQQLARAARANFWVFEHADEPGRFVEFTEGADASAVVRAHGDEIVTPLWHDVLGG